MDKTQAEAIVKAIMEPDLRAQEELQKKRESESTDIARKRQVAWLSLAGAGVGAAIAYYTGERFSLGVLWGGIAGSALGWLVTTRAAV